MAWSDWTLGRLFESRKNPLCKRQKKREEVT